MEGDELRELAHTATRTANQLDELGHSDEADIVDDMLGDLDELAGGNGQCRQGRTPHKTVIINNYITQNNMDVKVLGNLTIGQYIEQQNNYFAGTAEEKPTCEVEEVTEAEETAVDDCKAEADEALLAALTLFFHGNEEEARRFLHTISGKKPTFVIGKVNELVRAGKIGQEFKGRPLWKALHNAGLYKPTETNWNSQIK